MTGWEPAEVTEYEYDSDGRLVRSTTVREPEFDHHETARLIASMAIEGDIGPHGIPMSEATAKENQFAFAAEPVTDFAAKAIGEKSASMRKQYPDDPMHGVQYRVRKVDKTQEAEAS